MTRRQRGFTVIELMIAVAMIAIFSTAALSLTVQAKNEQQLIGGYQRDVLQARRALGQIESWLRCATAVEHTGEGIIIHTGTQSVVLSCRDDELQATQAGRPTVLARCIRDVSIATHGALAQLSISLRARSQPASEDAARIATSIMMRSWQRAR